MSNLIKWSGSKNSQSKQILRYFPKKIENYFEPFLGGGSVFLALLESDIKVNNYYLSDINNELIGIYQLIKDNPDKIIETYSKHYKEFNSTDIQYRKYYFNEIRAKFNLEKKSEDFFWLQRVCTNGAPRFNLKGEYNQSCHFTRPGSSVDKIENILIKYNKLFNKKNINFIHQSYDELTINSDDLIYMDPPYASIEGKTGMYQGNFNNTNFIKWLNNIDCKWILSYDGKINGEDVSHQSPNFINKKSLISGNSSFRRILANKNDIIITESIYMNF
jgi:DNA adenine methylase